jgi:beta-aspartyl-dipeptidase (metallo-type)
MLKLIQGGQVYAPEFLGVQDILVAGARIVRVAEKIDLPADFKVKRVSARGCIVIPGLVDLHVHLLGGGGEGGFGTRTPEIELSRITRAGVTTVVGCLGTDDVSRFPETLLAKAYQLEAEGVSTYIYTGSYQFPMPTITGSVRKDIALIPKVIGVGEIAVSDHRSSQESYPALCRVAAQARVGGMLGGKAGLVHLHMGDGARGLEPIFRMVRETEIPIGQFLPTHVTRKTALFDEAVAFAKMGGTIDITVGGENLELTVSPGAAVEQVLHAGVSLNQISLSSDANGSMPVFDSVGKITRLAVADIAALFKAFRKLVQEGMPLESAVQLVTLNPARRVGIDGHKGHLAPGADADMVILNSKFDIDTVLARGRTMIQNGRVHVKGTFER